MFTIRPAAERGHGNHGWLDSRHTFSFADYFDPAHNGFRALRVVNEDRVAPGAGFGMHPHRDMEILSVVLSGALAHKDSLGHADTIRPGDVQRITAGTGVMHSEFNPSPDEPAHFYQVWLLPDRRGHRPDYARKSFPAEGRVGRWQAIASPDGRDGSLTIRQDAAVLWADVRENDALRYDLAPGRHAWLQVLSGAMTAGGARLSAGDGLAVSGEPGLAVSGSGSALLFDLG